MLRVAMGPRNKSHLGDVSLYSIQYIRVGATTSYPLPLCRIQILQENKCGVQNHAQLDKVSVKPKVYTAPLLTFSY